MTLYKIELSQYGTIAERGEIEINAKNRYEAEKIAMQKAKKGEIEFSDPNCVDGYEIQVENCEVLKK